jgi:UDP-N-acetyl-D-mannosaminuronic acid dehydrogenase
VGGHCISVDPWFFVETAPELTSLIYHARQVNDGQPSFVVEKVKQALGSLQGKKIAALGLAYKPDVDDLRESPATEVVHLLQKEGARVHVWEPFKPEANMPGIDMATSLDTALQDADAILLLVRHTEFVDFRPEQIAAKTPSRILIDCVSGWDTDSWKRAGFAVYRLGVNKLEFVNQKP